jgi:nucleotidyltransferase/DNA polymerase involved in DNA repair
MGRLAAEGLTHFRTVVLTVRFADFETKSRSHTLSFPMSDPIVLEEEARKLFLPFLDERENPQGKLIRLLGVRVEKLERFGIHAQAPLIDCR